MFCEKLKELRIASNMTQRQLAEKCGVAQSCIALLEKGRSEANIATLTALSKTFGVSVDFLIGLEDEFGNKNNMKNSDYPLLKKDEKDLLHKYRSLSDKNKIFIKNTIDFLSEK